MIMSNAAVKALSLIACCNHPKALMPAGHAVINAGINACLSNGWVKYEHRNGMGYAVTSAGKAELQRYSNVSQG